MKSIFLVSLLLAAVPEAFARPEATQWDGLRFFKPPQPLPAGAMASDWPRFLGPDHQPVSKETKLLAALPEGGPEKVWECRIGAGYASPVIVGDRLVYFHRLGGKEQVLCLHPETGCRYWSHEYACDYRDRYGYANGPRSSAVVAGGQVFTYGVSSWLHALDLETGSVLWKHNCAEEFGVPQYFFGTGSSPLVVGDRVILNLGGSENRSVAAFDRKSGELLWTARHEWSQSYASPIAMELRGRPRVLVFAGGEAADAGDSTGGLLSLNPEDGKCEDAYFWRARRYTSVNASTPVPCGPNRVFISQAYVDRDSACNGGVLLEMEEDRKWHPVWKAPDFGCHWMTPVYHAGHLYAFSGEKEHQCDLVCFDAADGRQKWRERPAWKSPLGEGREIEIGFKRGSLLRVDGRFLCLGEWGTLAWLDLTPSGAKILSRTQLFLAQQTWTLPTVCRGLLYVCQHEIDELSGDGPRLICYDFRGHENP